MSVDVARPSWAQTSEHAATDDGRPLVVHRLVMHRARLAGRVVEVHVVREDVVLPNGTTYAPPVALHVVDVETGHEDGFPLGDLGRTLALDALTAAGQDEPDPAT